MLKLTGPADRHYRISLEKQKFRVTQTHEGVYHLPYDNIHVAIPLYFPSCFVSLVLPACNEAGSLLSFVFLRGNLQ